MFVWEARKAREKKGELKKNEKARPMAGVLQARMEEELAVPRRLRYNRHYHHQALSWLHW